MLVYYLSGFLFCSVCPRGVPLYYLLDDFNLLTAFCVSCTKSLRVRGVVSNLDCYWLFLLLCGIRFTGLKRHY